MKDRAIGKPKQVYVLSTAYAPAMGHTNRRDRDGNVIQKPTCINVYNHNMGGVDLMDQQLDGIDTLRKILQMVQEVIPETGDAVCLIISQTLQAPGWKGCLSFLSPRCMHSNSY